MAQRHFADVVVAVSHAVAREHTSPWLQERLRVIYNPVDAADASRPEKSTPLTFGYLGQVSGHKGVGTLLRAFQALPETPPASLMIAGKGPLADEALAAGPRVRYLGWIDEQQREQFFADIDCLVVPSEWKDPAPLVVNEAVARGVPVIGAEIGGIPELVAAESRPLLYPSGHQQALTGALAAFLSDPGRYRPPGPGTNGGWRHHLDQVLGAYDDARSSHRRAMARA